METWSQISPAAKAQFIFCGLLLTNHEQNLSRRLDEFLDNGASEGATRADLLTEVDLPRPASRMTIAEVQWARCMQKRLGRQAAAELVQARREYEGFLQGAGRVVKRRLETARDRVAARSVVQMYAHCGAWGWDAIKGDIGGALPSLDQVIEQVREIAPYLADAISAGARS